jgi:hypothetical protein
MTVVNVAAVGQMPCELAAIALSHITYTLKPPQGPEYLPRDDNGADHQQPS